jgi:hypothetical protein
MRWALRVVLLLAGTVGLVLTFRELTETRNESAVVGGAEQRSFWQKTEIGLAFSPWYVRTTDTTRKPVVEEDFNLLSWSVPLFGLNLALIGLSFRLERRGAKAQPEDATW